MQDKLLTLIPLGEFFTPNLTKSFKALSELLQTLTGNKPSQDAVDD